MRITNGMLVRNMMVNLNSNLRKMAKYQNQMSSGKQFQLPSENPIGMSKSLKLYTDLSKIEQYESNLKDAMSWMTTTENAIAEMGEIFQRIRELTVDAANGTKTDDDTTKVSEEIKQLKEQLIKLGNTTHAGRYVFTGYKTDKELMDKDGNYIYDPSNPLKSSELSIYNIGISEDIEVNTIGTKIFGVYDENDKTNPNFDKNSVNKDNKSYMIQFLDDLIENMENGNHKEIGGMLGGIDVLKDNLLAVRAEIGAKTNRLEMTEKRLSSDSINFRGVLSENEDVDPAEVIMNLKMAETVYLSSMAAGTRIIQPTLVDFLR
ncbi:flagellar hook-associated protein 3 [Gottschalkia purinilytica]|uniref:Flagellar hook-associated protein 3 n=1 Tax=Gottschalkia purinilytica TaxID=1503 RepID=A0A0L0WDZ4_GOTPU|nr:flagellar hook-associated protein FlgL [Gottschalkia purinilytica]KNF09656.1 flagellar hook-associated protein 3 [Gottschalkia purinilytica]